LVVKKQNKENWRDYKNEIKKRKKKYLEVQKAAFLADRCSEVKAQKRQKCAK
jgi:hypothetical protein